MSARIQALVADYLTRRGINDTDGFSARAARAVSIVTPRSLKTVESALLKTRTNLFQGTRGKKTSIIAGLSRTLLANSEPAAQKRDYLVLLLSANPIGAASQLALDEEVRSIREALSRTKEVVTVKLIDRWAVRPGDILQYLNDHRVDVIHFSGHGSSRGMVFSDGYHGEVVLSTHARDSLFRTVKSHVRLVILNYCNSIADARIAARHIGYAIGMRKAISDDSAAVFSAALYRALATGKSVRAAFNEGRLAISLQGLTDHAVPVLLTKPKRRPTRAVSRLETTRRDKGKSR
jgi:hypothetical protein